MTGFWKPWTNWIRTGNRAFLFLFLSYILVYFSRPRRERLFPGFSFLVQVSYYPPLSTPSFFRSPCLPFHASVAFIMIGGPRSSLCCGRTFLGWGCFGTRFPLLFAFSYIVRGGYYLGWWGAVGLRFGEWRGGVVS